MGVAHCRYQRFGTRDRVEVDALAVGEIAIPWHVRLVNDRAAINSVAYNQNAASQQWLVITKTQPANNG